MNTTWDIGAEPVNDPIVETIEPDHVSRVWQIAGMLGIALSVSIVMAMLIGTRM